MPVTKNPTPEWNFGFRDRPKDWIDSPVTVTDEDGLTYTLTLIADADGNVITPVSNTDLFEATTTTNELLEQVVFFLKSIAER